MSLPYFLINPYFNEMFNLELLLIDNSLIKDIVTGVFSVISALLTVWYREKWLNRNKPDLKSATERVKKIENILSEIQYELDAMRVNEWAATNGEKTLTGHSIQKLSIMAEYNRTGVEAISHSFQSVPATNLSRNLIKLAESKDGIIISHESDYKDDLSALHKSYEMETVCFTKISDIYGKWVGVLCIAFDTKRKLTEGEIAFIKLKASQIGGII